MKTTLSTSALEKAIGQLTTSLEYLNSDLAKDVGLYAQFRSASIQSFEYTYELTHKLLKKYLQQTMPSREIVDEMTFSELIRTGYEKGLLGNSWDIWKEYRDARNRTSHTYQEALADDVVEILPSFLLEAQYLCHKIQKSI